MGSSKTESPIDYKINYFENETLDDDASVKSTDSEEDEDDRATTRVYGTNTNGLRWITVDEKKEWHSAFEEIEMPLA